MNVIKYVQNLYEEIYKTLIHKLMERCSMFMDKNIQYYKDVCLSQIDLQIKHNLNHNNKLL